jgi:hypothetical protein
MSDLLLEGLRVAGLLAVLLLAVTVLWALVLGLWRAVTGETRRQQEALSREWVEGWNAAMRGSEADRAEWVRRMDEELGR